MKRYTALTLMLMFGGSVVLGGCSERERAVIRAHDAAVAAEKAAQERQMQEYTADQDRLAKVQIAQVQVDGQIQEAKINATTQHQKDVLAYDAQRKKDALAAEAARQWQQAKKILGLVTVILSMVGGVFVYATRSLRQASERLSEQRTRRYTESFKTIQSDLHLTPEQRQALYHALIEAPNGPRPRPPLGYPPYLGGASS